MKISQQSFGLLTIKIDRVVASGSLDIGHIYLTCGDRQLTMDTGLPAIQVHNHTTVIGVSVIEDVDSESHDLDLTPDDLFSGALEVHVWVAGEIMFNVLGMELEITHGGAHRLVTCLED